MGGVSSGWRGCEPNRTDEQNRDDRDRHHEPAHTERKCTTYLHTSGSRFLKVAPAQAIWLALTWISGGWRSV
jgi:hypothetical protein